MNLPSWISIDIVSVSVAGGFAAATGWLWRLWRNRLTLAEKQILVSASSGTTMPNYIWHFKMPGAGREWIRAGDLDLGNDKMAPVIFIDAFEKLIGRGLVRHFSRDVWQLTGRGVKLAEVFAKTIPLDSIPH